MAKSDSIKAYINGEVLDADDLNQSLEDQGTKAGVIPYDSSNDRGGQGDLGTTSAPFGDLYLKAGSTIKKGNTEFSIEGGMIDLNFGYVPTGTGNYEINEVTAGAQQAVEIRVDRGVFYGSDNTIYTGNAGYVNLTLGTSDATNPRWDLVYLDASVGTYNIVMGTASSIPPYPVAPSGMDPLAYVYRIAGGTGNTIYNKDILDTRTTTKMKNVDGHFKTNFSIDQKEDTETTEYDNQQAFEMISLGTKFNSLQADKLFLQNIETVLVPADSHETTETGGGWADNDAGGFKFGRARISSTVGDTIKVAFTGVSCGFGYSAVATNGYVNVELSSDGGSTWGHKKTITLDYAGTVNSIPKFCYSGLEYGDYEIRITVANLSATFYMEYFFYTTYMNQRPITQYALSSGGAGSLADVPPTTCLITGTWVGINQYDSSAWNSGMSYNANTDADIQFKFYGSKCWVNAIWGVTSDVVVTVTIDGSSAKVKSATINMDTPANNVPGWVRLDDGTLDEGWHTIELHTTTVTAGNILYCGFGYYSAKAPTTIARSLICGKNSYKISPDDSGITYTGTWAGVVETAAAFLRRTNTTTTQNDYFTYTIENDSTVKAIYGVFTSAHATRQGELEITLGGALTRYIDNGTQSYIHYGKIALLYDSFHDGALHNKELKILLNDADEIIFEGLIIEKGDPVESDNIFCMPKWTRYNNSTVLKNTVSPSHRLDVYGAKSDGKQGRLPSVHSGFCYNTGYYRHGLGVSANDCSFEHWSDGVPSNHDLDAKNKVNSKLPIAGDPGVMYQVGGAVWNKIIITPNRII